MREVLSGIYLSACALQDIRSRRISLSLSAAAALAAAVLNTALLVQCPAGALPYLTGLIPGALLLLVSLVSHGAAGAGDGVCFLILGALLGARKTWILLTAALFCACIGGGIWLALGRAGRRTKLPFLAFAAVAWSVQTAVEVAGMIW